MSQLIQPPKPITVQALPLAQSILAILAEMEIIFSKQFYLVERQELGELSPLVKRQNELVAAYQANIKVLETQPDLLKQLPADMRAKLKAAGHKMADITTRNMVLVAGAIQATRRLVQNIITMMRTEVSQKQGYTDPRKAKMELGSYSPQCESVAVNRTA